MEIPLLPKVVELTIDAHHEWTNKPDGTREKGELKKGMPKFFCRPISMLHAADYLGEFTRTQNVGVFARAFAENLSHIEDMYPGGDHFDPGNPEHMGALDPGWAIELGRKLLSATRLTEQELGKSS